jgi:hypothetical protein
LARPSGRLERLADADDAHSAGGEHPLEHLVAVGIKAVAGDVRV